MDMDAIRGLLGLVAEYGLQELDVEVEGLKLKVRTVGAVQPAPAAAYHLAAAPAPAERGVSAPPRVVSGGRQGEAAAALESEDLAIVTSPIVGTFYSAPEPGAPPFVESGARVKPGQTLCIIEAMKLMNEIESDHEGELVAIYAENGQPVQYGERLFAIKLR